ncbi:antitoxin [Lapillicoccus jejuensis]|uniref:Antitoxin protein of toxin-antitoxin system n=1 Tax=Lapillicoccus jejuensis TaxID=402171 RepID=A0A542E0X0_9MICO|nr:antitoxin [Lapillicoccus jejuensis]TQJ08919.1 antitoxin protein of toxin-antitoxin system [Lapillicoccus jejuensis]
MGFMDKLKQKADEYDLQGKADKLAQQIEKGTQQAVEKAGELAHENRDKIATGIDKAGATFDERTQGKYSDKVAKAKDLAAKGVDKVAEQRPGVAEGGAAAAGAAEGTTAYGVSDPTPQDATPQDAVHPPAYGTTTPTATTPTAPTTGTPGTTPTPSAGATPPPGPADPVI